MREPWYKNAIIYAIDVDYFFDSDANGNGDFEGVRAKLDYLAQLGVTCLWLLPFYPTPYRDNGYDISNYYGVDPRFGTIENLTHLLREAGARGLRVVLDLVVNHTSNEHPWFQAARNNVESRYRNYYIWTKFPPPQPPGGMSSFPCEEEGVWTFDDVAGEYYYHRFYHFQPALNFGNPAVIEEVNRILDFWLAFRISGFRVDAAFHMIQQKGLPETRPDDPNGLLRKLHDEVERLNPDAVLIGEVDTDPTQLARYFGKGDQLHMLFNFFLNNMMFLALARHEAEPMERALRMLPSIPQEGEWVNFARNLDELNLERLADDEREDVLDAFAPQENMRVFCERGIRRRLAPMLGGDRRRLEMVFSLVFSMPGAAAIVYGDEIGMGEDLSLDARNAVRMPMQWDGSRNAGFSQAKAADLCRKPITGGKYGYEKLNVQAQLEDENSFLNWMKRLIWLRRQTPEIGLGSSHLLDAHEKCVLGHRCEYRSDSVLALHNFADEKCEASIHPNEFARKPVEKIFGNGEIKHCDGTWRIALPPYGYIWLRTGEHRQPPVMPAGGGRSEPLA